RLCTRLSHSGAAEATACGSRSTLSLHDALPISLPEGTNGFLTQALGGSFTIYIEGNLFRIAGRDGDALGKAPLLGPEQRRFAERSEEHTSELQSLAYLVCRPLLEKKKQQVAATR